MIMYRTKSPTPKSKEVLIKAPKVVPVERPLLIKLTFVSGLKSIVLEEISRYADLKIVESYEDKIYLEFISNFKNVLSLKSVLNAYIVKQDEKNNPYYISNHKSILGDLIDIVLDKKQDAKKNAGGLKNQNVDTKTKNKTTQAKTVFKTFKLRCAGSDSKEAVEIQNYIANTYKLKNAEDSDLEIYISKPGDLWEVSVRLTTRPLSLRDYRVANIKGGLNPTIAYAMNTFCNLNKPSSSSPSASLPSSPSPSLPTALFSSYLNVFSGSGTLLIEAGLGAKLSKTNLKLVGFDIDGKTNALAIQNIKKADLIKQIHLKTADIYDKPHLGKFDVIVSDLPFGIQISSKENLNNLYKTFVSYCEETLNKEGVMVVYTTEYKILQDILESSKFDITKTLNIVISTADVNTYLYPRIFVCKLK